MTMTTEQTAPVMTDAEAADAYCGTDGAIITDYGQTFRGRERWHGFHHRLRLVGGDFLFIVADQLDLGRDGRWSHRRTHMALDPDEARHLMDEVKGWLWGLPPS